MYCQYTECRIPGWATSTFRLVCAWCSKRVGQARFPAAPRAFFFSRFRSEKKWLSRVKKLKAFSILTKEMIKKTMHM